MIGDIPKREREERFIKESSIMKEIRRSRSKNK